MRDQYHNKSFIVGKKPMCKNCDHYVEHWNWLNVTRFCKADSHIVKNARCRCTIGQFKVCSFLKLKLKTGEIIEVVPIDNFCAAKYVNKDTNEYVFDEEIQEILG